MNQHQHTQQLPEWNEIVQNQLSGLSQNCTDATAQGNIISRLTTQQLDQLDLIQQQQVRQWPSQQLVQLQPWDARLDALLVRKELTPGETMELGLLLTKRWGK